MSDYLEHLRSIAQDEAVSPAVRQSAQTLIGLTLDMEHRAIARRRRAARRQEVAQFCAVGALIVACAGLGILVGALSVALAQTLWESLPWS